MLSTRHESKAILPSRIGDTQTPIYKMHVEDANIMLARAVPVFMKPINISVCLPSRATTIQKSTVLKLT